MRLYLASTSPARLALLRSAGIEPVLRDPAGDEDGLILGGDSVFVLDGVIYGKPHTAQKARERWHLQRGRTGHLYSGHWLIERTGGAHGRAVGAVAVADVT